MNGWTQDVIKGKPCAARNRHLLCLDPLLDRPLKKPASARDRAEGELQRQCEAHLERHGYKRLVAKHAHAYATGWFGHMHKPQGNPFMPDLFIFHEPNDRAALLVELKTKNHFQTGQREMTERGAWTLCWTFAEFESAFNDWAKQ